MHVIRIYSELMRWFWRDESDARILALQKLAFARFDDNKPSNQSLYDAVLRILDGPDTHEWFTYHFEVYLRDVSVIHNLQTQSPDRLPLTWIVIALLADLHSADTIIPQLDARVRK